VYADHAYHRLSRPPSGPSPVPITLKNDSNDDVQNLPTQHEVGPKVLQRIPEATFLNAKMMLRLSRDLFMNRSSEFPSPWPHWSEYTSELASEPSMYRTAFIDFHTLAVSVTKRLVHTTLMQTESRLRSQRPRARHEVQPFIKRRDVLAAVDVLGMKRNGNDRWKGAARRCGLKVFASSTTSRGKRKTVVPWDEVERIVSADVSRDSRPATDVETSTESEEFKNRAARSGTPLPMHNLTLSDSEEDSEPDSVMGEDDDDLVDVDAEEERFRSAPSDADMDGPLQQLRTLEDFDREASRQEEQALCNMFGLEPRNNIKIMLPGDETHDLESEKLNLTDQDWRHATRYRAYWEDNKPPSAAKFLDNCKLPSPMPACYDAGSESSRSLSRSMDDDSSSSGARRPRRRRPAEVELRARGATAYAALQREELGGADEDDSSSSSDAEEDDDDDVMEQDIPTQSIEAHDESSDY
jgi:RNA polymerase I-specific transcription initiation factor RRN5